MDIPSEVRLFPLPNVVLLPYSLLPLHIFEARYQQMLADALADDQFIAMVLTKNSQPIEPTPQIRKIACLGKVVGHAPLEQGRSNILLQGVSRVVIERELDGPEMYRRAAITALGDVHPESEDELASLRATLRDRIEQMLTKRGNETEWNELAKATHLKLGQLCDLTASWIDLEVEIKQEILETVEVRKRAELVLAWVDATFSGWRRRTICDLDFSDN